MKPYKHTIESATLALKNKGLDSFLSVKKIDSLSVILIDQEYGEYRIDLKSLAPKTAIALHKRRRHDLKLQAMREKHVGQMRNGIKILNVFYGPDHGYKNRSFYLECEGTCGHSFINSYASLMKHRKNFICHSCSATNHGERKAIDGILKKRSSTYIFWQRIKESLPDEYQDFSTFKKHAGDKPFKRAEIIIINNKPVWKNLQLIEDEDLNLIATAIRQAFRHSSLYKSAMQSATVETEKGTRYRCAACGELFQLKDVQVDHITPIARLDGLPIQKEELMDIIWTDKIQVLDRKCHTAKSTIENKQRRLSKNTRGL